MVLPLVSSSSSKSSSNTSKPGTSYSTTTTSYTITFNKDGGSSGSSSVSAKKGQSMPYATAPTKKGYTFGGYYTSRNGQGTKYYSVCIYLLHSATHIADKESCFVHSQLFCHCKNVIFRDCFFENIIIFNMFFHFQYDPSFICRSSTRRRSTEKTQKCITSNHEMPMSTTSANYCVLQ